MSRVRAICVGDALDQRKSLSEIMYLSGRFGAGGRFATICAAPSLSPFSYMIIASWVSAF
jgi:hypothetical protein